MGQTHTIEHFAGQMVRIGHLSSALMQEMGIQQYCILLEELAELKLFISLGCADSTDEALHKYLIEKIVTVYDFKDKKELLTGSTHVHSEARMIGVYLLRKYSNYKYQQIGHLYNLDSRSWVADLCKKMESLKDFKGNIDLFNKFRTLDSFMKIYSKILTNYDKRTTTNAKTGGGDNPNRTNG